MTDSAEAPAAKVATTTDFAQVLAAELARIALIRKSKRARKAAEEEKAREAADGTRPLAYHVAGEGEPLVGLALSGGGIRSAAFNLGIMQAFANRGLLARFDYLSSVSGGGYIASALTWFLSRVWGRSADNGGRIGTGRHDHPLGRRSAGGKTSTANNRIDHIRCMGNYLRPTPALWTGSAAALVVRAIFLTILMWFPPLVLAILLLDSAGWLASGAATNGERIGDHLGWLWWPAGIFGLLILVGLSVRSRYAVREPRPQPWAGLPNPIKYLRRLNRQQAMGIWLFAGLGCALIALLPRISGGIGQWVAASGGVLGAIVTLAGLFGKLPFGLAGRLEPILLRVGVVLAAYGLLVAALWLPQHLVESGWFPGGRGSLLGLTLVAAALAVIWAWLARLNHLSLHRLYRDRLMEAFLPDPESFKDKDVDAARELGSGVWQPAQGADIMPLSRMCDGGSLGPYHLINANVIFVNSENAGVRGRGGESFLLSPLWSGSDRTGWCDTRELFPREEGEPEIQLASAMALSGAAANPNAGPGGSGLTRSAIVSALMMLLNIRLGYWVPNPKDEARARRWSRRPRFLDPGFAAVIGVTHHEESRFLELTDGGHFENLGIYELIRRRVPVIVACDAGQDGEFAFADLGNAVERARVDFGAHVRFDVPGLGLGDVVPAAGGSEEDRLGGRYGFAARGFAIARVSYPPAPPGFAANVAGAVGVETGELEGCLIYVKATLIDGLAADVYAYRAAHETFPHQSTGDQFFDEPQFEAYRGLGYDIADAMLELLRQDDGHDGEAWMRRLRTLIPPLSPTAGGDAAPAPTG